MSREISSAMERSINDLADDDYELIIINMVKPDEKKSAIVDQTGEITYHDLPADLVDEARGMTLEST